MITSGNIIDTAPFSVNGQKIPSIHENPVKILGRCIDVSLSDATPIDNFIQQCNEGLVSIDKSFHRGIHKLWILQHLLIPRLRWPISIYEVSPSTVLKLEQKISTYARKWLKLRPSISTLCLYSDITPCPMPLTSLSSVLKASKVNGHLQLRDSKDPNVKNNLPVLKSGKMNISDTVMKAENAMEFKKVLGYHQMFKAGLGSIHHPELPEKGSHAYRKQVTNAMEEIDEVDDLSEAVQLSVQGQWTRWLNYVTFDL